MSIRLHRSSVIPSEGFTHGFPERTGGVSTGLRASLNLGMRWGDDRDNVETNRRLVAEHAGYDPARLQVTRQDRKSTRLNSSHSQISYAVFCLKKKKA